MQSGTRTLLAPASMRLMMAGWCHNCAQSAYSGEKAGEASAPSSAELRMLHGIPALSAVDAARAAKTERRLCLRR